MKLKTAIANHWQVNLSRGTSAKDHRNKR